MRQKQNGRKYIENILFQQNCPVRICHLRLASTASLPISFCVGFPFWFPFVFPFWFSFYFILFLLSIFIYKKSVFFTRFRFFLLIVQLFTLIVYKLCRMRTMYTVQSSISIFQSCKPVPGCAEMSFMHIITKHGISKVQATPSCSHAKHEIYYIRNDCYLEMNLIFWSAWASSLQQNMYFVLLKCSSFFSSRWSPINGKTSKSKCCMRKQQQKNDNLTNGVKKKCVWFTNLALTCTTTLKALIQRRLKFQFQRSLWMKILKCIPSHCVSVFSQKHG